MVARRRHESSLPSLAERFSDLRSDYDAARPSRFRRVRPGANSGGRGADYHYRSEGDYLRMLEFGRDTDRNDPLVGQCLDRIVANVVQNGFTCDPITPDKEVNKILKDRWLQIVDDPEQIDTAGESTFNDKERLCLRQSYADGDCFELPQDDGTLESVEGHRCRTPKGTTQNVIHGVKLDQRRRRLEYWFTKNDIEPCKPVELVREMERYTARDAMGRRKVFHIYDRKRSSQTRGVTAFAPLLDLAGQMGDIVFAKLVRLQVAACFAVFRERATQYDGEGENAPTGEQTNELLADGSERSLQGLSPAMQITGKPGESLKGFAPGIQDSESMKLLEMVITLIGANLGAPLMMVLLDSTKSNFSGWRGAYEQAKMGFRHKQRMLRDRLHRPYYSWRCWQWLLADPVLFDAHQRLGAAFFWCNWGLPSWPYINPFEDAGAELLILRNNLNSPRRVHQAAGRDVDEIRAETIQDNSRSIIAAKRAAQRINKRFPDDPNPVTWREVISLPTPDGLSIKLTNQTEAAPEAAPQGSSA